jgi:diaminopimelate decarboxylase
LYLGDFRFRFAEKIQDFGRFAVNEFGSQFDGAVTIWIEPGEYATADAITSFEDVYSNAGVTQLACRGQSCHAAANHDYGRI